MDWLFLAPSRAVAPLSRRTTAGAAVRRAVERRAADREVNGTAEMPQVAPAEPVERQEQAEARKRTGGTQTFRPAMARPGTRI